MGQTIFISYSHKDETYFESFLSHLGSLEREGLISAWHDRRIVAGQDLDKEIDENLKSASVIVLLISSDFVSSDYCFKQEMDAALELHERKSAVVVPVIVRSCDWARTPIARFKALPKDGLAVAKWDHQDDAWLDVVSGIRNSLLLQASLVALPTRKGSEPEGHALTQEFQLWLDDTEILLTHRKVSKVRLRDVYVDPDLKRLFEVKGSILQTAPAHALFTTGRKAIVFGEEQQGKTTFLKKAFLTFYEQRRVPVLLYGQKIKSSNIDALITEALEKQYDPVFQPNDSEIALLIDDIDQLGINTRARSKLLNEIVERFDTILITGGRSFSYVVSEIREIREFQPFEFMRFGHVNRAAMAEKWVSMGVEEQIPEQELYLRSALLKEQLDGIIRGNIVPPKPIYVLMLLQMFEATARTNLDLTSEGHCYQELIYAAFRQADVPNAETDSYLNILTEFAWAQHKHPDGGFLEVELHTFFDRYEERFLKISRKQVAKRLQSNSILIVRDGRFQFKYPYLFYFFVAKKIAEGYGADATINEEVALLLRGLHREDYANILVFVTHHTKGEWILEEVQLTLMELFQEDPEATLESDQLAFLNDFISGIPSLVLEQREVQRERIEHHRRLDSLEEDDKDVQDGDPDYTNALLARINKTFKGMEIAGQIIRNRHASMTRDNLYALVKEGAGAGLRFLDHFIKITDISRDEVISHIERQLAEHPNISDQQIEKIARDAYLQLTYGVINGVIRKIGSSIGSREAGEIYDQLQHQIGSPATLLINRAIAMHHHKNLDIDELRSASQALQKNQVCLRILKEIVIQHLYMFPVDYRDKQRVTSYLGIPVQTQRLMDMRQAEKG